MVSDDRRRSERLSRRQLLATGALGSAALAGCIGRGTTTLPPPETKESDLRSYLVYYAEGDDRDDERPIVEFGLYERWDPDGGLPYRIRLRVGNSGRASLAGLKFEFDAVTAPQPGLAVERPDGNFDPFVFVPDYENESTRLEFPEIDALEEGSIPLSLLVDPPTDDEFDFRVTVDATLSPDGFLEEDYELRGEIVRSLPGLERFE